MTGKTTFIYALCDPKSHIIRYIGKSNDPEKRFKKHLTASIKAKTHLGNWLQLLNSIGLRPTLEILDEVVYSQWEFWEREYIRVFRAIGMDLVNTTDGGDGGPVLVGKDNPSFGKKLSPERCAEISVLMSRVHKGVPKTAEQRAAMSAASMGKPKTPEHKANLSAAFSGEKHPNFGKKDSSTTVAAKCAAQQIRREKEKRKKEVE